MVESSMSIEEFLHHDEENNITQEAAETEIGEIAAVDSCEELELDVQKAVVESLAAEKVERDERIDSLEKENARLSGENDELKQKIAALTEKLSECENELSKVGDLLLKNSETEASNKISLLDRNIEMPDRFVGETREQVLEVIKEARDQAEAAGRIRRAQVLEGVLVANESTGELAKKRNALEKFFNENGNILSGTVIAELDRCAIAYKNGEDYLLTSEIIRRTY
jgi:archaellum component FlaC